MLIAEALRRSAGRRLCAARAGVAVVAAIVASPLAAEESLPYTVAVEVVYAEGVGSASVAEDVRRRVSGDLRAQGRFREVRPLLRGAAVETDLVLRVTLRDVLEETRHETSIAERSMSRDPTARQRYLAIFQVDVEVSLVVVPGGEAVRFRRFRQYTARRPMTLSDDAIAAARDEGVNDLARSARKAILKGSPKKLERRIEAARAAAAAPGHTRR